MFIFIRVNLRLFALDQFLYYMNIIFEKLIKMVIMSCVNVLFSWPIFLKGGFLSGSR